MTGRKRTMAEPIVGNRLSHRSLTLRRVSEQESYKGTKALRRLNHFLPEVRSLLEETLRNLQESPVLPESVDGHPNELVWLMFAAWAIDGRRGDLKQEEISALVEKKTGERFDRNQMLTMVTTKPSYEKGTLIGYQTLIPSRGVMKALIEVVFENWFRDGPSSYNPPLDLAKVTENAVAAIANHDWYYRRTNLLPLLNVMTACNESITIEKIEILIASKIHFKDPIKIEDIRAALEADKKLSG